MGEPERRKAERHAVDYQGRLFLSEGRRIPVRILNLGELGALVSMTDLEEAVMEAERAVLEHPVLDDDVATGQTARTPCSVVRVELEFAAGGVSRHLALYFDGGGKPAGYG
jgi:hypothetical protein